MASTVFEAFSVASTKRRIDCFTVLAVSQGGRPFAVSAARRRLVGNVQAPGLHLSTPTGSTCSAVWGDTGAGSRKQGDSVCVDSNGWWWRCSWRRAAVRAAHSQQARTGFAARPELLEFGAAAVGRTKTMKLRLANEGRASYRVEGALRAAQRGRSPFEPFALTAGGEHEIEVRFTPDVEGAVQGQVELFTDAGRRGDAGARHGRGVKALVEVTEPALDFGNVTLGWWRCAR